MTGINTTSWGACVHRCSRLCDVRNISSNALAFEVGVDLRRTDRMMATLPFFHSFGYTVCLWAPVVVGMQAVYYLDPRAAQEETLADTALRCCSLPVAPRRRTDVNALTTRGRTHE